MRTLSRDKQLRCLYNHTDALLLVGQQIYYCQIRLARTVKKHMVSRLGSQRQRLFQPQFPVTSTILSDSSKTPSSELEFERACLFLSYIRENN